MKMLYERPNAEIVVFYPNAAIAYISGTDSDKDGASFYNSDHLGNGGVSIGGAVEPAPGPGRG